MNLTFSHIFKRASLRSQLEEKRAYLTRLNEEIRMLEVTSKSPEIINPITSKHDHVTTEFNDKATKPDDAFQKAHMNIF